MLLVSWEKKIKTPPRVCFIVQLMVIVQSTKYLKYELTFVSYGIFTLSYTEYTIIFGK